MSIRRVPRIGLTTYREPAAWGVWHQAADVLPATYAGAVQDAGGAALLLPPGSPERAESVLDGLHGLVITGGADVDPARYGATAGEHTDRPRTDRDEWEIALTVGALRRGLPLLGICRGLQVLNVVLGGTLVQHLPDATAGTDGTDGTDPAEPVRHGGAPGEFVDHAVRIDPASRLGGIVGAHAIAASHHHQGIDRLAADLVATAWTADGLIEAVERSGPAWVLAVQWHPEVRGGQALFTGFVEVCSASYAGSPTSTVAGVG